MTDIRHLEQILKDRSLAIKRCIEFVQSNRRRFDL